MLGFGACGPVKSLMFIRTKRIVFCALTAAGLACLSQANAQRADSSDTTLQEHLHAAQNFQQSGNLVQAAAEYRAFLAETMGRLALGYGQAGEYSKATSYFDEALTLKPDSPQLRLEYAKTALAENDSSRAETLAKAILSESTYDSQGLAQAHQILGRAYLKTNRDQDAKKELEAAVKLNPSFENGYDLAVVCLDMDDEKCATQVFSEMEASFGDTPAVHMSFGRAFGNSDFAPKAVAEFKKAIQEDPRLPGAHYSLAAALLATGDTEATIQEVKDELKRELAISPNDSLSYSALGKLEATHHNYVESEKYLKQSIEFNPKNPDAFLYLGQMYFDTDRIADAKDSLRRAIELTTDESRNRYQVQQAHFLLGRVLMQEHQEKDAHAEMEIARAIANKGLSQDKRNLAGTLSNGMGTMTSEIAPGDIAPTIKAIPHNSEPDAIRDLNNFEKQLTPAIADGYNNLGAIAATNGQYLDALQCFERAGEWNPALEGLDLNWGRAAFMASRFSDAVMPLSRYLRSHPADSGIRIALAMSKFMTRDYAGCIEAVGKDEDKIASVPQMQYAYAESLVKIGQVSSGMERLTSLEALHPEIADVHRSLGEALEVQGETQKAMQELHMALQFNAKDPEAHYDLGKLEIETGNAMAAIEELNFAIRLLPREPDFHRELSIAYKAASRPADADKELQIYNTLGASPTELEPAMIGTGSHNAKLPN